MKKIFLFLLLLFTPLFVFAKDTCDSSSIKIEAITLEDTKGNIEEVKEASSSGQKINLGLRMNVVGDMANYRIVLRNTSSEDYYFDEKSLNLDTDYVDYTISYEDDNNLMKGGEEKVLFLKVVYKEKMDASTLENGLYQDTQVLKLNLTNNNLVEEILENPITGSRFGIIVFIILIIGFLLFFIGKRKSAYLFLIVGLTLPFSVRALCRHSLEIENDLIIDAKEAVFLLGQEVNVKMKQLAGDDTSTVTNAYSFKDETITSIQYSEIEPDNTNKEEKNVVSIPESGYPIYMWYDNGVIYWWSEDKTPALNENSSTFFYRLIHLNNINGIEKWDSSFTKKFDAMFSYTSIANLNLLKNWNMSSATSIGYIFYNNYSLTGIDGIENWDTSNVTNMSGIFSATAIESLIPLKKWNTSNVTNMDNIFNYCTSLQRLDGLEEWDTSNVTSMALSFNFNIALTSIDAIKNWNVSKVVNMHQLFCSDVSLEIADLSNWKTDSVEDICNLFGMWNSNGSGRYDSKMKKIIFSSKFDTSKVTNMSMVFANLLLLETIEGIELWDTSKVTAMRSIFSNCNSLKQLDISNFDTRNVNDFSYIFNGCSNLEVIYVGENWSTESNTNDTRNAFANNMKLKNFNKENDSYRDLKWAHTGEGGYLTLKKIRI